ncbi:helicase C-terminal domain-domain-containing protein [Catenaria anguillulae PL171]|uniref:DNA 5'-3' helicase n=1 Tax=Catenaria anguillulae PL171 TaxID=765915 RepID=A0A1Y2HFP8_9FUNG|nr:helicase C-terminal domain-domain-containing protein [Catenaria anguillulae PL171]
MTNHSSPMHAVSESNGKVTASESPSRPLFQSLLPSRALPASFATHGALAPQAGGGGLAGLRMRAKSRSGSSGSLSLFGPSSSSSSTTLVRPSQPAPQQQGGDDSAAPQAKKEPPHPAVGKRATKPPAKGQVQTNLHMFQSNAASTSSCTASSTPAASAPAAPAAPTSGKSYSMSSIPIHFPFPAYPSQLQMMSKIIAALNNKQNALLESPTGSGKSLAILCATLAWRQHEAVARQTRYERDMAEWEAKMKEWSEKCKRDKAERIKAKLAEKEREREERKQQQQQQRLAGGIKRERSKMSVKMEGVEVSDSDSDDDFVSYSTATAASSVRSHNPALASGWDATTLPAPVANSATEDKKPAVPTADSETASAPPVRPTLTPLPKIYLASRTHKQLAQLVSELAATSTYRPRMSVLGSRHQYCIHTQVCSAGDRNAACAEAVDKNECRYYEGARALKLAVARGKLGNVWDVEDLKSAGLKQRGCPYFAARALADEAELVLCPYNYLMDASIRGAMNVDLDGAVVVVDEAHNVEDVAREAASMEVDNVALTQWEKELKDLVKFFDEITDEDMVAMYPNGAPEYRKLLEVVEAVRAFVSEVAGAGWQSVDFERKVNVINPDVLIRHFATRNITPDQSLPRLHAILQAVGQAQVEHRDNKMIQTVSEPTYRGLSQLYLGLSNVMNQKYTQDFHVVVMERVDRGGGSGGGGSGFRGRGGGRGGRRGGGRGGGGSIVDMLSASPTSEWHHKFALWCMNPAVTFRPLADSAHSIILTSGTLSPMATFASELGTEFPIRLEADHVIRNDQSLVGILTHGLVPAHMSGAPPMHVPLVGDYKGSERLEYQDAVGDALVGIASVVPHGVLVFGPSYAFLEKLVARWKVTGVWAALEREKGTVMMEPRGGKEGVFDEALKEFYDAVDASRKREEEHGGGAGDGVVKGCGAVLFGVFRGKVSEGIDFSNHRARAVVCIGIPYPHAKDKQVALKKDFNDRLQHSRGLLSGHEWYNIQAFRALNQALGRCIRHRGDWGALILLDQRMANPQLHKSISKWVRPRLVEWRDTQVAVGQLTRFVEARRRADLGEEVPPPSGPPVTAVHQQHQQQLSNGHASPQVMFQTRPPAPMVAGPPVFATRPESPARPSYPPHPPVYTTRQPPPLSTHSPARLAPPHYPPPAQHLHEPTTHSPLVSGPLARSDTFPPPIPPRPHSPHGHLHAHQLHTDSPQPTRHDSYTPPTTTEMYTARPLPPASARSPAAANPYMPAGVFHFARPLPPTSPSPASSQGVGGTAADAAGLRVQQQQRQHVVDMTAQEDEGDAWWDLVAQGGK